MLGGQAKLRVERTWGYMESLDVICKMEVALFVVRRAVKTNAAVPSRDRFFLEVASII